MTPASAPRRPRAQRRWSPRAAPTARRSPPPARAGSRPARASLCSGTALSSQRGTGTEVAGCARRRCESSPWDLHPLRRRLIEQLRRVLAQTVRERTDVFGRGTALTYEALDLREALVGEGADVLAVLGDCLVELEAEVGQVVGNGAHSLECGTHVWLRRIEQLVGALRRGGELRACRAQLADERVQVVHRLRQTATRPVEVAD